MRRIVRRLHHEQFLATLGVVIVAGVTFFFLALLGGNQQSHIKTDALVDNLHTHVIQIGTIHRDIANDEPITPAHNLVFMQTTQNIDRDLADLKSRMGDTAMYRDLEQSFGTYVSSLEVLIGAKLDGSLPDGESPTKAQSATALISLAQSIRETRAQLTDASTTTWKVTQVGFGGAVIFLVVAVLVITRLTEHRLRRLVLERERARVVHERDRKFSALMENISDTIVVLDPDGRISYASSAVEQILGSTPAEVTGTRIVDLIHPDDAQANMQALCDSLAEGAASLSVTTNVRVRRKDDSWVWVEAVATNRLDVPGIDGIVINARDITERRRVEEQLRFHALHDPLTGLANRTVFSEHIEKALKRKRRSGSVFAVLFMDLDGFKHINDAWGHGVGDELLVDVARRLRTVLREVDTAARHGGDEFVLLIEDLAGVADAMRVAERIHAAMSQPFEIDGQEHYTSASIGIVISNAVGDADVDDILRFADLAMYQAKREGREGTAVYSSLVGRTDRNQSLAAAG